MWYNSNKSNVCFIRKDGLEVDCVYEELCEQNKGLLVMMAQRYANMCALDRAVSMEDLVQTGFIGLIKAAKSYDPGAGKSWAGWACWHIQMEFNSALGLRHGHITRAHTGAVTLDKPLSGDEGDGVTTGDMLADESLPDADAAILQDELQRDVRAAVSRLRSERQRRVVQLCKLEGLSYRQVAQRMGVSIDQAYQLFFRASGNLSRDPELRKRARLEALVDKGAI